jgi:predicted ATPase/DNA-binding SARP family transcriptional activator
MSTLMLHCFGSPRVERDGQPLSVTRRRTMALLIYLALTGRPHSREALATLLWPENDAESARSHFRRELFRLKQLTGPEPLLIDREQVALKPEAELEVDVLCFRRHLQTVAAHGHAPGHLCSSCHSELTKAIALYDEAFLTGFNLPDSPTFDEWQFFQGEELRQQMAGALQALIAWHETQGDAAPALPLARRWLSFDALHEEAHRALMRLYSHAGQYAAALRQYETCARLLDEELGIEPDPETTALYEQIRARQLPAPESARPAVDVRPPAPAEPPSPARAARQAALPVESTPFVGRSRELAELAAILGDPAGPRLVSLVGPGGIGKTRLAIEAAWQAAPHFDGAAAFVSLAPLDDPEQLAPAIARALNVELLANEDAVEILVGYLRGQRLLLVLDNFEHLREGAPLLATLLQAAPDIRLLATSRERLNLSGELVYALEGLGFPQQPQSDAYRAVLGFEAMMLLLQRVQLVRPGYEPESPAELAELSRICRLLQGVPLALVLAAGWFELLSPAEIAAEITRNLDFLESDMRDLPPRQRSVRAVFNASWRLLDEPARQALTRLSIFRGSFTREAAEAAGGASLVLLRRLVNQSWLQRVADHYQVHELLRQYAEEQLRAQPGRWEEARERHADYYATWLTEQVEQLKGRNQQAAFAATGAARDNLFLAWEWWVERGQFSRLVGELLPGLYRWHETHARASLLFGYLRGALAALPADAAPALRASLLAALGAFYRDGHPIRFSVMAHVTPAHADEINEAWQLVREEPDALPDYWSLVLAGAYGTVVDAEAALLRLEQLLARLREQERRWAIAFTLQQIVFVMLGRLESEEHTQQAAAYLDEAFHLFQELGDKREGAYTLRLRGYLHRILQDFEEAIHQWQAAHRTLQDAGDQVISTELDWQIGDAYLEMGDYQTAFAQYRRMSERALASNNLRLASRVLSKESYEAARYGDLEHAEKTRRQSLAIAEQRNDTFGVAWYCWEMGELLRLRGEPQAAREWYERARTHFENFDELGGLCFYFRGLGDLALDAGNFPEAGKQFAQSLLLAERTAHRWAQAYAHGGLAQAALWVGDEQRARAELLQALNHARGHGERSITLYLLAMATGLLAAAGQPEQAAALAGYVAQHPVSWRQAQAQAQAHLAESNAVPALEGDVWEVSSLVEAELSALP